MGNYNIDINLNMGSGGSGNFQQLIDATNNLAANFNKVSTAGTNAGNSTKQSFADSMAVMAQYGNSVKSVSKEISNLKKQIIQQNEALKQGRITEAQHKDNIDNLHKSLTQLQRAQRQYNQLLGQTTTQVKGASTAFRQFTNVFNKLGAVLGVSFGLYGFFRVLQNVVKTIAEFDLAQKKLQSILGETSAGMHELTQSAIDLGRYSIFGAKGVSELQIELAKMGFTKNEIIAMQGAINDLAIATQEDLASSAEVVANIIKTYGLTATETRDVVNVMGKAFNDSALGLSNFRESIKYVAPVAKQAGLSFRETVAALELLSNAGLKGSLAGTGLNNVLNAMMNSNSKLSKSMGGTVKGWDGFVSVLQKARDGGMNMQDIFGLITQRATGAFSTFLSGLPTLEKMEEKLIDVSNVMADQAAVQTDSLTYRFKLLQEQWNATMLDFDSGNGVLSKVIKNFIAGSSQLLFLLGGNIDGIRTKVNDLKKDLAEAGALDGLDARIYEAMERQSNEMSSIIDELDSKSKKRIANRLSVFNREVNKSTELLAMVISKAADEEIAKYDLLATSAEDFAAKQKYALVTIALSNQEKTKSDFELKVAMEAMQKIEMMRFERETEAEKESKEIDEKKKKREQERLKRIQKEYNERINLLKEEMQTEALRINTIEDNYLREVLLATNKDKYLKQINELEIERDKKLGEYSLNTKKIYAEKEKQIELERIAELKKASDELIKESDKLAEDFLKESNESVDGIGDEILDAVLADIDKSLKSNVYFDKWKKDNPILNALIGGKVSDGLLSGILSEEQIGDMTESLNTVFDEMGKAMSDYADSWVEQTDRIVDQLNRQVDETQSALETEIALMEGGYANNVTLKRKELEDVKKLREEALADQKKAQMAQETLDTITQASSLITAAAQIFKSVAAIPFLGVNIATGLVVAMLGAFAAAKVKAFQLASTNKYEYGGWIGGKRHTNGGTIIEAERDEFIINRKSAVKHKGLVEAINNDNQFEINRFYLNKLKGNMITAKVSLDDSKDLKAIRKLMESGDKQVEYQNGYRIERTGNIVKRIKLLN